MPSLKWTKESQQAYKDSGEVIRALGGKPIRDVYDKDGNSVLTFWATRNGLIVTQVFTDTGDVCYLKGCQPDELAAHAETEKTMRQLLNESVNAQIPR